MAEGRTHHENEKRIPLGLERGHQDGPEHDGHGAGGQVERDEDGVGLAQAHDGVAHVVVLAHLLLQQRAHLLRRHARLAREHRAPQQRVQGAGVERDDAPAHTHPEVLGHGHGVGVHDQHDGARHVGRHKAGAQQGRERQALQAGHHHEQRRERAVHHGKQLRGRDGAARLAQRGGRELGAHVGGGHRVAQRRHHAPVAVRVWRVAGRRAVAASVSEARACTQDGVPLRAPASAMVPAAATTRHAPRPHHRSGGFSHILASP